STAWNAQCSTRIAPTKEDSDDLHERTNDLRPRHGNVVARGGPLAGGRTDTGPATRAGTERRLGLRADARCAAPYVELDHGPADAGEIDSLDVPGRSPPDCPAAVADPERSRRQASHAWASPSGRRTGGSSADQPATCSALATERPGHHGCTQS